MPAGRLIRVPDFLPPPDKLIIPNEPVKVTITLSRRSVEFFKREARLHRSKYQKMIREVLDRYTAKYGAA
jgi:hypothetical protein